MVHGQGVENHSQTPNTSWIAMVDEFDKVNTHHTRERPEHWTNYIESNVKRDRPQSEYRTSSFLSWTVKAAWVNYVRYKLQEDPSRMHGHDRPLLDYALRPGYVSLVHIGFRVNIGMVRMLLDSGADPNESVPVKDELTVWTFFLFDFYTFQPHRGLRDSSEVRIDLWYQACELLIHHGAREGPVLSIDDENLTLGEVLKKVS